jgi:hypothetical protein
VSSDHQPNPRAPRRRTSTELARAVRGGHGFAETLRALDIRADEPDDDDRALVDEFARTLVHRCDSDHRGWQMLRDTLQHAGAAPPWARCERQAFSPTAQRLLSDCATAGRTPLLRVQHAAAQERARALAPHIDRRAVLNRLDIDAPEPVTDADWERALVAAVNARSQARAVALLQQSLG